MSLTDNALGSLPQFTRQLLPRDAESRKEQISGCVASVLIRHGTGGKGRLEIRYNSLDELDGILEHIK